MYLIDRAVCEPDILRRMHEKPVYGDEFAQVKLLDRRDGYERAKICCGAFSGTDQELQCVEMDDSLTPVPEFPYNWQYDGANGRSEDAFQMDTWGRRKEIYNTWFWLCGIKKAWLPGKQRNLCEK